MSLSAADIKDEIDPFTRAFVETMADRLATPEERGNLALDLVGLSIELLAQSMGASEAIRSLGAALAGMAAERAN